MIIKYIEIFSLEKNELLLVRRVGPKITLKQMSKISHRWFVLRDINKQEGSTRYWYMKYQLEDQPAVDQFKPWVKKVNKDPPDHHSSGWSLAKSGLTDDNITLLTDPIFNHGSCVNTHNLISHVFIPDIFKPDVFIRDGSHINPLFHYPGIFIQPNLQYLPVNKRIIFI